MNKKAEVLTIRSCPSSAPCSGAQGHATLSERHAQQVLDTCGHCDLELLLALADRADLVIYDLMAIDPIRHQRYTGHSNPRILSNLLGLAEHLRARPDAARVRIRTPLVPGTTATDSNLTEIGQYIAAHLAEVVERWELCAFDNPAAEAYRRLGQEWPWGGLSLMAPLELQRLCAVARGSGVDPRIVEVVGADCATAS